MEEVTPAMLEAEVSSAADILHGHILATSSTHDIALARAIYNIQNDQWTKHRPSVLKAFGGKRPSAILSLNAWHDIVVSKANEIVSWETTTDGARRAYANRRKSYQDYMGVITSRFDRFYGAYKQLATSGHVVPLTKTNLTPMYISMLRREVLAWYDRQQPSRHLVLPEPQEGVVHFMVERRDMTMVLKTGHAIAHEGPDRLMASDACKLQLALAPVLGLAVGLYKLWEPAKIVEFKDMTELERAVLAVGVLVPAAARILKAGRLVYTPTRLAQIYGGDPAAWEKAIGYSAVLSKHRPWQQALDSSYKAMVPGVKLSGEALSGTSTVLSSIVSSPSSPGSFLEPAPIEPSIKALWTDLASNNPWLTAAPLDVHALRRVLLMGSNLSHIQAQILAELAESRVATLLRNRDGVMCLGIDVPEGCTLEFVPGHAFRAGDENPEILNRQISDGVIGYWLKDVFVVAAMLEVKANDVGGRELGHEKTTLSSLTLLEQAQLRAFSNREWVEAKEVAERKGEVFKKSVEDYDSEILKFDTGSQVTRDIDRLDSSNMVRINGILGRVQLLQDPLKSTKILAVVPKSTEPENLKKEVIQANEKRKTKPKIPFQFEPFAMPVDAAQLKKAAENAAPHASRMVYCPGTTNDAGSSCTPASTPAEFIKYLQKVYDLAIAYGSASDANVHVMEWLRHVDYNTFEWDALATMISSSWILFVSAHIERTDMIDFVSDPLYPVNIKVSHFGASLNGVMYSGVPNVDDYNLADFSGWAGDLITFYGEWQRDKIMPGSKYCHDYLGRPGDKSSFKLRDFIEDVDAFNVARKLLADPSRTIVQEVEALFKPDGGYKTRFSRFLDGRFAGVGNATKVAKTVLTSKDPRIILSRRSKIMDFAGKDVTMPSDLSPVDLDDFCKGFAEVLTALASSG